MLGLVVISGLALGAWGLFASSGRIGLDRSAFAVEAGFDDIGGVDVGARVRIQGMDAGEVEAVTPPSAPGQKVRLRLRVSGRLHHLVTSGAHVEIASESLLSGKIVRIVPGSGAPVDDGAELAGLQPTELTESVHVATVKLNKVLTEIDGALHEFRTGQGTTGTITRDLSQATVKLNGVLAKIDATIDGVEKGEGTLGQLVKNDNLYRELTDTISQVRTALVEVRSGEGTLGKLVKSNEVYAETLHSLQDVRKMVASVKQNADAIKSLPVVRSYVVDAHKELIRPDCTRYRKWFPEAKLFEPGRAMLTPDGKKALDEIAGWLNEQKDSSQDVVIAGFADDKLNADFAQTLSQKQSEAVLDYLKSGHRIHRTGFWFWSNRSAKAIGVGNSAPPVPETQSLPPARIEVLVFVKGHE